MQAGHLVGVRHHQLVELEEPDLVVVEHWNEWLLRLEADALIFGEIEDRALQAVLEAVPAQKVETLLQSVEGAAADQLVEGMNEALFSCQSAEPGC